MFKSIRTRITLPFVILILLILGSLSLFLARAAREAQLDELQQNLFIDGRLLAQNLQPLMQESAADLDDRADSWSQILEARVTIIDADGSVVGESALDWRQLDNHLHRPEIRQALQTGEGSSIRFSETLGIEMAYAAVTVKEESQLLGFVRIALPLAEIEANIDQLQSTILTAMLLSALAASIMAIIIADRTQKPIQRLTEVAQRMAGGDLDARLYLHRSRDEVGQLTQAFNHMADQLRQQVTRLENESRRLAAMLDNMADGVIITDEREKVILINPAAAQLLNTEVTGSSGRSFAEVARHHELIDLFQRACREKLEDVAAIELDREGTFIQMIVTPLQTANQSNCLIILQDLTAIRRLEMVRRDFISNISHELRTPLASLKALVETLRDSALEDPPMARRFLDRADSEVDALTQMVQELLELSRIESGQVPLRLTAVQPIMLLEPALERFEPQAQRNELELALDLPPDLPDVLVDQQRMRQVVSNLVHNAIRFTPDGGQITLGASLNEEKSAVIFSVKDTGVGIPTNELKRIFERFYKADRARRSGGTGLGLAIARHLVEAHGGQIWAESKEGKGATLYFSIPVVEPGTFAQRQQYDEPLADDDAAPRSD